MHGLDRVSPELVRRDLYSFSVFDHGGKMPGEFSSGSMAFKVLRTSARVMP